MTRVDHPFSSFGAFFAQLRSSPTPPSTPSIWKRASFLATDTLQAACLGTRAAISVSLDIGALAANVGKVTLATTGTIASLATAYDAYVNAFSNPQSSRFHQMNPCGMSLPTWRNALLTAQQFFHSYSGKTIFSLNIPSISAGIDRTSVSYDLKNSSLFGRNFSYPTNFAHPAAKNSTTFELPLPWIARGNSSWVNYPITFPQMPSTEKSCKALTQDAMAKEFNQLTFAAPAILTATIVGTYTLDRVAHLLDSINHRYFKDEAVKK